MIYFTLKFNKMYQNFQNKFFVISCYSPSIEIVQKVYLLEENIKGYHGNLINLIKKIIKILN